MVSVGAAEMVEESRERKRWGEATKLSVRTRGKSEDRAS